MTRLPAVLRIVVLALLVLALAVPSLWRPASVAGRVVRIRAAGDLANVQGLLAGDAPAAVSYESPAAPSGTDLDALAALADVAPVFAAPPG
ncbi:MAG TPA: hypothetical protein VFJ82_07110, partial [Longimicrobium sp.]|nr:hypothetical protein [Longimicrobium sp.]